MPRFKVYPYKQGSASAKTLANSLEGKVLKHVGSKFKPRVGDVVVNWGSSAVPDFAPAATLNADVGVAQCKLASLRAMRDADVAVPRFTHTKENVLDAIAFDGWSYPIVCRTKLRGHSGDGIVIAENAEQLVDAPLYTQYVKKKDEYRVHVMRHEDDFDIFFIQRKARKLDVENPDWRVRNLAGGFVFAEQDLNDVPHDVRVQACAALKALGLDFGGVDVIWNEKEGKAYILEVNTACGLEERTADKYAEALNNLLDNNH